MSYNKQFIQRKVVSYSWEFLLVNVIFSLLKARKKVAVLHNFPLNNLFIQQCSSLFKIYHRFLPREVSLDSILQYRIRWQRPWNQLDKDPTEAELLPVELRYSNSKNLVNGNRVHEICTRIINLQ